jgi:hypothetical protein
MTNESSSKVVRPTLYADFGDIYQSNRPEVRIVDERLPTFPPTADIPTGVASDHDKEKFNEYGRCEGQVCQNHIT